ncbi:hypothetical protein OAF33_00805 [bacterium]|nr:hypothetical protein [bacterium]
MKNKLITILLLMFLVVGLGLVWQGRKDSILGEEIAGASPLPEEIHEETQLVQGQNAQTLGKGSPLQDLKILQASLAGVILMVKDFRKMPIADNSDFTAVLTGENSAGVRWLDRQHPAINEEGEIVDQWGTAIQFHRESWSQTTLRSAGPDLDFYSEDDLVIPAWE